MRRLLHHLVFAVVGFVFISSVTASGQNHYRPSLKAHPMYQAAGVPTQQERLTPDGRAILERGLNPDMLAPALPGHEGRLRPELLDYPGEPPAPEAEFPDRFKRDLLQDEPDLLPGGQAEPSRGRLTLLSKALGPTGARTEVYYYQRWNGTAYETYEKRTHTWNDADYRTERLYQIWDSPSFMWVNALRYTYDYDAAGNRTLYQSEEWDTSTGEQTYGWRYTYAYDFDGNQTLRIGQVWDTVTSAWVNYDRYTCDYAAGNLVEELHQLWDGSAWVVSWKYTYTYNAAGNLTSWQYEDWDTSTGEKIDGYRWISIYDANGNNTQDLNEQWDTVTQTWVTDSRDTWTYDTNGNWLTWLRENWDSASSTYVNYYYITYDYNAAGNLTLYQWEYWDTTTSAWVYDYRSTYTYDFDGNRTSSLYEWWDPATSVWVIEALYTHAYDAAGNRTLYQWEEWDTTTGEKTYGYSDTYAYDAAGNPTLILGKTWDTATSAWVNEWRYTYTYNAAYTYPAFELEEWDTIDDAWVKYIRRTFIDDAENTRSPAPAMLSVADVLSDQGGKVRLSFERSRFDVPDPLDTLEFTIVSYTMWRLIEENKWDALGAFNAVQDSVYYYVAPTINDSTRADGILWHTYRVSAHTPRPDVFFYSDTLGGYSVDNIPPDTVRGLVASLSDGQLHLSWDIVPDNDLGGYHLFELAGETYDPDQSLGFTATESITFTLPGDDVDHTYVVVAEDVHGNLGEASNPVSLSSLGVDGIVVLPAELSLHQNYPNPFNPATTIRYDLPEATDITIVVYNLAGREIARLVEGHVRAGYHQVVWQGRTAAGREVPTGIYIARFTAPGYSRSIKMVMMK